MRLLRAMAHLALALALIGVAVAPARALAFLPGQGAHGHVHHGDGLAVEHAAHDHGTPASEHPAHKRDACQTLCCFIPSQLPPHAAETSAVEFYGAVRYVDRAEPAHGRVDAPDPGIPKPAV